MEGTERASILTVSTYLDEWLDSVKLRLRTSTWEGYRSNVVQHVVPALGDMSLRDVTPQTLTKLYADLASSGNSRTTGGLSFRSVRYVHAILSRAFGEAVRWGYLDRNPVSLTQAPRKVATTMSTWNAEQVSRFLVVADDDPLRAAWILAVTTGMRRGEILGLRWSDVDLSTCRLSVRQTLLAVHNRLVLSEPKTKKGLRQFTLPSASVEALRRVESCGDRATPQVRAWAGDLVFIDGSGQPIHPDGFTRRFGRLCREAELPKIRFHDLRHTFATLALGAGIHVKVVSEILGHSNINITLETYSHVLPELQADALEKVAAELFRKS